MRKNNVPLTKWEVRTLCIYVGYALCVLVPIILKLAKLISWPWIGVLAPVWAPILAALLFFAGAIIYIAFQCKDKDFSDIEE